MDKLLDEVFHGGPKSYKLNRLSKEIDLFRGRTAQFYTPTEQIPTAWVGRGSLDVTLPITSPSVYECVEIAAYRGPRLWVDLLQRATGKLRWTPMIPGNVSVIRYESTVYSYVDVISGLKEVVDALKVKTTGRRDGRLLYYFRAIFDDNEKYLAECKVEQEHVDDPSKAFLRIVVEQARGGS